MSAPSLVFLQPSPCTWYPRFQTVCISQLHMSCSLEPFQLLRTLSAASFPGGQLHRPQASAWGLLLEASPGQQLSSAACTLPSCVAIAGFTVCTLRCMSSARPDSVCLVHPASLVLSKPWACSECAHLTGREPGCDVGPWDEGGMDLPLQQPLARRRGQSPSSEDRMLLLEAICAWAEVVAVMGSGRGS